MNQLFTIGHSTHSIDLFIRFLKRNQIDVVIDVRSVPYSRVAEQYNKESLNISLKNNGLYYLPMGNQLGARYEDERLLFTDRKVDFNKVMATTRFQDGIKRIHTGIEKGHVMALMCSELNPLECHRFSLIARVLDSQGYSIGHILPNSIIAHKELENKLLEYFKDKRKLELKIEKILSFNSSQPKLFDANTAAKSDLYLNLNKRIAYSSSISHKTHV